MTHPLVEKWTKKIAEYREEHKTDFYGQPEFIVTELLEQMLEDFEEEVEGK